MACPSCGRMMGGNEWRSGHTWWYTIGTGYGVCSDCPHNEIFRHFRWERGDRMDMYALPMSWWPAVARHSWWLNVNPNHQVAFIRAWPEIVVSCQLSEREHVNGYRGILRIGSGGWCRHILEERTDGR